MDLLSILPNFPTKPYTHLLPPLERSRLSTVDLITLDTLEIAKRAHVPPADVRRFSTHVIEALHGDVGFEKKQPENVALDVSFDGPVEFELGPGSELNLDDWSAISTLDDGMDEILEGGIPTGYLTEVTGESGSGKTQFLLTLLLAVQLPSPKGLEKRAIYLSTEAPLSTQRLSQLLKYHPYLSKLPASKTPNLTNILSINAMDLESQDHILNYQLPVAIKRYNVGLVIIDSITSNYRAEHPSSTMGALSSRSGELAKLGQMLRNLAATENLAVIVANQVSDRFTDAIDHAPHSSLRAPQESAASSPAQRNLAADETAPLSSQAIPSSPFVDDDQGIEGDPARNETLSLLHQQRFFTGWGDTMEDLYETGYDQKSALKTPALGLVWSSQIACRIALKKEESPHFDGEVASTLEKGSWAVSQVSKEAEGDKKEVNESIISTGETGSGDPVPPISEATGKVTRRTMKLVMAPWTAGAGTGTENPSDGVDFVIGKGGFSSTRHDR